MIFRSARHKADFYRFLKMMKRQDSYHQAIAYLLALDDVMASNYTDVFDFAEDFIKIESAFNHGWQTGTSQKTTRLLFNLWNGCANDYDDDNGATSNYYTVDGIFCSCYAPYYWEAIKLRYPEYCAE